MEVALGVVGVHREVAAEGLQRLLRLGRQLPGGRAHLLCRAQRVLCRRHKLLVRHLWGSSEQARGAHQGSGDT